MAAIAAQRRRMIVALNQRESLLAASCYEGWFHTSLGCVAGGWWIQDLVLVDDR